MQNEIKPNDSIEPQQFSEKIIGIVALVCGSVLAYLSIIAPLLAAERQEQTVSLSLKGAIITPPALALGLVYTILGKRASNILGHPQHPSKLGWAFTLVFTGIGILVYFWLKNTLGNYGYTF